MEGFETKLKRALLKFKINDFPVMLPYVFGRRLTWEDLKRGVDEMRLKKHISVLADVCVLLYRKTRPSKEDVVSKLWLLQLCDVCLHTNRDWFGMQMTDPFPEQQPELNEIEEEIAGSFKKDLRDAIVVKIKRDKLMYIMIVESKKTKKGSLRYMRPVFFVLNAELEAPVVFFSPELSEPHPLELFSSALGFQDYKFLSYKGREVSSLFEMVHRKISGTVALRPPTHIACIPPPVYDGYVTDLTHFGWRRDYAQSILTGATQMKQLTVESTNEWRGTRVVPHLENLSVLRSKMTIQIRDRSATMEDVLTELTAQGNINVPLPSWVMSFADRPRESMTLRSHPESSTLIAMDDSTDSIGNE